VQVLQFKLPVNLVLVSFCDNTGLKCLWQLSVTQLIINPLSLGSQVSPLKSRQ